MMMMMMISIELDLNDENKYSTMGMMVDSQFFFALFQESLFTASTC